MEKTTMWSTILTIVPSVFGVFAKIAPAVFGKLHGKTEENKGATLATLFGAGGFMSNPDVRNFLAEMLVTLREDMLRERKR